MFVIVRSSGKHDNNDRHSDHDHDIFIRYSLSILNNEVKAQMARSESPMWEMMKSVIFHDKAA